MTRRISIAALLGAAVLSSCDAFDKNTVQKIDGPVPPGAFIKFYNFGVRSPQVNFYADGRKMTGIQSGTGRELSTGVAYGGVGAGGFYTAIAAGQYTLSGRISDTLVNHNLAISNLTTTLEDGKVYSFYQSGFYDTTAKAVDAFILEDNLGPQIDFTAAYVRFVHAISNANPLILYATKITQPDSGTVDTLGTAVAYKGAGAFMPLGSGLYNLAARYQDSTSTAIRRDSVAFGAWHVYTIGARGDITLAFSSTTAPTGRFLDFTVNR